MARGCFGGPSFFYKAIMRTFIYVDGFNLYYRALKDTSYKWLDLKKLFQLILQPQNQIVQIKYFTAIVSGSNDPDKPTRQKAYLNALQNYIPEVSVYYGHFLSHVVRAPLATPINGKRTVDIIKTEEKGSDVNIAVHMLNDAWLDLYDCAVVVSNDSDLAESMKLITVNHPHKIIGLISPIKGHPSKELMKYAKFKYKIRSGPLSASQLPDPIPGTNIRKPFTW